MNGKEKSELYAKFKISLKNAKKYEFWLQAIFIEYAMLEDRTESALRHAGGIKLTNSQGHPLKLSEKLNKLKSNPRFADKKIRKYISLELLDSIGKWKKDRDTLIHGLMNVSADDEKVKQLAFEGERLVNLLSNRVDSVKRIFEKENDKGEQ